MKRFLINLLLFAAIFFVIDKAFLLLLKYSGKNEVDKRLEMVLNGQIDKDIIVLGSSRGARNINAALIEKQTRHTAYNLSYPGSNVEFHDFVLKALLEFNKKPKLVVLTVDSDNPSELTPNRSLEFRLDRLYPLVKYDYAVDEMVNRGEKNKLLTKLFVLHRLTKSNFDIRQKKFKALDSIKADGSMPITFQDKKEKWNFYTPEKYNIKAEEAAKVKALQNIVSQCAKNNIKLLIAFSPNYSEYNKEFDSRIRQLAGNKAVYYVYNTTNKAYRDKNYYYDKEHLMANGAAIFTSEISTYINAHKKQLALQD